MHGQQYCIHGQSTVLLPLVCMHQYLTENFLTLTVVYSQQRERLGRANLGVL